MIKCFFTYYPQSGPELTIGEELPQAPVPGDSITLDFTPAGSDVARIFRVVSRCWVREEGVWHVEMSVR